MAENPVQVTIPLDGGQDRLWGIPFVGLFVRAILVIPHAIILFFVAIAMYLVMLVSWIPILLDGRMAGWGYTVFGGYVRLSTRVSLYVSLVTGSYPPFGLTGDHPVVIEFDRTETQNRLWGIPLVGLVARWILLIPHYIVLWFLSIGIGLLFLVSWVPILVNGRQADSIVRFHAGTYRWIVRVTAYALLLTGRYPPFSFE